MSKEGVCRTAPATPGLLILFQGSGVQWARALPQSPGSGEATANTEGNIVL